MLHAFIDESYTDDRYYLAAVIVPEESLYLLEEALQFTMAYAGTFGIAETTEFHAHSLMSGRDGWEPIAAQVRSKIAIYQRFLDELAGLPAAMIIRGVDVRRLNARYRYPDPPHQVALQHLLEQIDSYAKTHGEQVHVVADEVPEQKDHAARMLWYQAVGTPGYLSSHLTSITGNLEFLDSKHSAGLQAADAAAYVYRRYDAHTETNPKVRKAVVKLWDSLAPIRTHVWRWDP